MRFSFGFILIALNYLYFFPGSISGQAAPDLPGCRNYLQINGESNVNQFSLTYQASEDRINQNGNGRETIEISIPIKEFRTSNPMMYQDFLELMQEDKHPRIRVTFSRDQLDYWLNQDRSTCPEISITIAGITRKYRIDCSIAQCSDNIVLKGEEVILLSDFRLKPPEKLMGLVKVNNEISVDFGFIVTFTEPNELTNKF
jgi:hypothetical protein